MSALAITAPENGRAVFLPFFHSAASYEKASRNHDCATTQLFCAASAGPPALRVYPGPFYVPTPMDAFVATRQIIDHQPSINVWFKRPHEPLSVWHHRGAG